MSYSPVVRHIPNILTYIRLCIIPVFVFLMQEPSRSMLIAAIILFIIGALTDLFDGMIARRYGAVSDMGKLLDPLADKMLVMAALVMLSSQRDEFDCSQWVPGWVVVLILAREFWVTGLRALAASKGVVVAASDGGKIKSVLQMVAIVLLLFHPFYLPVGGYLIRPSFIGGVLLAFSLLFSYLSAVEYSIAIFSLKNESES